ncbi:2,3-bisphosphoglycerate-independent phosphoglycerate mutase [Candidatus Kuenenbacteria bacterium]|nr:2,3-bisphosphoglycerate-independent phosphoglycerate mutase [Candidatus Kuenenbacteria bacterium]
MKSIPKPVALIVLDGWGVAPESEGNGVTLAKTPNYDKYVSSYPAMTLLASGEAVGLSWGEMGNSEVGHLNLGVGKIFYQNLPRIDKAIEDNSFFENEVLKKAIEHTKKHNSKLHLLGIISQGKVHGVNTHCYALLELAKKQGVKDVFVHAFLDGRDSKFDSGKTFIKELEEKIKEIKVGEIASLHGRLYAMDRDNRWERVEKTFKVLVEGKSEEYDKNPVSSIEKSYKDKVYDEEFVPVVIGKEGAPTAVIEDNDAVICFNYRADRARQLAHAFVLDKFDKFDRGEKIKNLFFASMTEYEKGLPVEVIFPKEEIKTSLPKVISEKGFKQLHIAETEKYAHITFFFAGGVEDPYEGEDRIVIPSPKVASYDEKPEMSARKVTDDLLKEILSEKHDFIILNYANPDMVGHTGQIKETVKSIETIDKYLGEVVEMILSKNGLAIIVADHGNAEELTNLQTGEKDKEHSTNPVPCLIIGKDYEGKTIEDVQTVGNDLSLVQPTGLLSDVAPTILKIMGIDAPDDMTGRPLI